MTVNCLLTPCDVFLAQGIPLLMGHPNPPSPELWLLAAVVVGLSAATAMAGVLDRFKLPPVLGYIVTGVLIHPLIGRLGVQQQNVDAIAHIGVVLLLFMVGLELSPGKLNKMRDIALRAGVLQGVVCTGLLAVGLHVAFGATWALAGLLGATLSLSSTAIVLKSLEEQQGLDTTHGRLILGTLIVQDMAVVPLLLLWPLLQTTTTGGGLEPLAIGQVVGVGLLKAGGALAVAVALSFKLVPLALDQLAKTRSRELFTLSVVCLGLGVALLAQGAGLSMEAGAFIAGLSLSGSIYSRQVIADSRPFRDVFATLFFVSVGLVVDLPWLAGHGWVVAKGLALLISVKILGTALAARWCGFSWRTALWSALSLFQAGEFAFLLLRGILPEALPGAMGDWLGAYGSALVHATVVSMFLTPLVMKPLPQWLFALSRWHWVKPRIRPSKAALAEKAGVPTDEATPTPTDRHDQPMCGHTVVVGYGPMGQQVAAALAARYQPYVIVDTNPSTVKRLVAQGVVAIFGDITQPEVQTSALIENARTLVLTLPDAKTAAEATRLATELNPELAVMARVRFAPDVERLLRAGASHAVHEELEAGLRLALLTLLSVGFNEQEAYATRLMLRDQALQSDPGSMRLAPLKAFPHAASDLFTQSDTRIDEQRRPRLGRQEPEGILGRLTLLAGTQVEWFEVCQQTPLESGRLNLETLRQSTGANLIGVIPASTGLRQDLTSQTELGLGDVLIAVGTPAQLDALEDWLQPCDMPLRI
jgi:monovalent cation:H+ antiporter-2, CPA2 family